MVAFTIAGRPDLAGTIKAASATLTAGKKADVSLTWENKGLASAAKHYDRIYLNTKKAYGGTYLGQRTRDVLAAGKSGSETFSFTPAGTLAAGTYYLNYLVDSSYQVAESDETNNVSYHEIKIEAVPDLLAYYIKASTTAPVSGQTVTVTWYVYNYWLATSPKTTVRFFLSKDTAYSKDDVKVGEADVASLVYKKAATGNVKIVIPDSMTGTWRLLMVVDPDDNVFERLENNNLKYTTLTITAVPDIAVTDLTVTPSKAKVGTQVTVAATHKNLGNKSTGFTASLYLMLSATQSVKLMEKLQPTLDPGKEATAKETALIPSSVKAGTYKLRWVVTVAGEPNKTNNTKEVSLTVE